MLIKIILILSLYLMTFKRSSVLNCGLFGAFGDNILMDKIKILGIYNIIRGRDSCGLAINDELYHGVDDYMTKEKNSSFDDFIENEIFPEIEHPILLGHTRKGTMGKNNKDNAHPFKIETDNGTLIGIHNGQIHNYKDLCAYSGMTEEEITEFSVDSKAFLAAIGKVFHDKEKLQYLFENYNGAAAIVFYFIEDNNKVYYYHGESKTNQQYAMLSEERPLFLLDCNNTVYFSSLEPSLKAINNSEKIIHEVLFNKLFELQIDTLIETEIISITRKNVQTLVNKVKNFNYEEYEEYETTYYSHNGPILPFKAPYPESFLKNRIVLTEQGYIKNGKVEEGFWNAKVDNYGRTPLHTDYIALKGKEHFFFNGSALSKIKTIKDFKSFSSRIEKSNYNITKKIEMLLNYSNVIITGNTFWEKKEYGTIAVPSFSAYYDNLFKSPFKLHCISGIVKSVSMENEFIENHPDITSKKNVEDYIKLKTSTKIEILTSSTIGKVITYKLENNNKHSYLLVDIFNTEWKKEVPEKLMILENTCELPSKNNSYMINQIKIVNLIHAKFKENVNNNKNEELRVHIKRKEFFQDIYNTEIRLLLNGADMYSDKIYHSFDFNTNDESYITNIPFFEKSEKINNIDKPFNKRVLSLLYEYLNINTIEVLSEKEGIFLYKINVIVHTATKSSKTEHLIRINNYINTVYTSNSLKYIFDEEKDINFIELETGGMIIDYCILKEWLDTFLEKSIIVDYYEISSTEFIKNDYEKVICKIGIKGYPKLFNLTLSTMIIDSVNNIHSKDNFPSHFLIKGATDNSSSVYMKFWQNIEAMCNSINCSFEISNDLEEELENMLEECTNTIESNLLLIEEDYDNTLSIVKLYKEAFEKSHDILKKLTYIEV